MQRAISFSDSICQNLYISILRETIHSESNSLSHPPHPPNSRFIVIFLKWIFQLPQKPEPLFISWEKSVGVERAQAPRMLCPQQGPQGRALAVSNLAKRPLSGSSSHFQEKKKKQPHTHTFLAMKHRLRFLKAPLLPPQSKSSSFKVSILHPDGSLKRLSVIKAEIFPQR